MESQWKLKQQHDQNFSKEGNPLQNKILVSEEKKSKTAELRESQPEI